MGLSIDTGVLTMRTTAGDDTIALVDQNGSAFAGKAVWLWSTLNSTYDTSAGDAIMCRGISDGAAHFSCADAVQDAQATSNANRYFDNKALVLINNVGTLIGACTAAFSGNNLVLSWSSVPGTAYRIHYFVLGGSDLTNAKVITSFTAHTTADGTSVDRTGFGFDPDFACFLTAGDENAAPNGRANASCSIGFAANKASRKAFWLWQGTEDNDATEAAFTYAGTVDVGSAGPGVAICFEHKAWKAGAAGGNGVVGITAWITDGFTEKWYKKAGNAFHYGVLALKGLQYDINIDLCPTSTGSDSLTGFGFAPVGMLHFMANLVSDGGGVADLNDSMGAVTSLANDEHAAWFGDNDSAGTSEADRADTATYHLLRYNPGTPTLDVAATMTSLDSDGFTQNFSTAPGTAAYQGWVAFGAAAAATGQRRRGGFV